MSRPFDVARYQGLLEGLEITCCRYSQLEADLRIDSEFFEKSVAHARIITARLHTQKLSDIADVADGDHAKLPDGTDGTIRYLQARDFDGFVEPLGDSFVSKEYFFKNQRSRIEANNILFSIMGTVGQVGLTPKDFDSCMANRAVGIIRPKEGVSARAIFAYLGSHIGRQVILGYSNCAVQQRVNLDLLRHIDVPRFSGLFEKALDRAIDFAFSEKQTAALATSKANSVLIRALGLQDWQPPEPLTYTRRASEAFAAGRLDAQFFDPKVDELLAFIGKRFDLVALADSGKILKGVTAPYYENGTVPIIRSGDLKDIQDDSSFLKTLPSEAIFDLQIGDLLISSIGFGSIGKRYRCLISPDVTAQLARSPLFASNH